MAVVNHALRCVQRGQRLQPVRSFSVIMALNNKGTQYRNDRRSRGAPNLKSIKAPQLENK